MNCCLWIILLLACRGNHGCGCQNNWRKSGNCDNWMKDRDCGRVYDRRCDCNCDAQCDSYCEENNHMNNCSNHDDCGYRHNENCSHMSEEDCGCMQNEIYECSEKSMTYETFGCQENGIPCPPPVPGNYMR